MVNRFEKFSLSIFNISRCWNKIAAEEMKKHRLKASYAIYLVTMATSSEALTAAKLCGLCGRDKADVSRAITLMEQKDLLTRNSESAYRAELRLTADGKAVANHLCERAALAVEIAGKGLSDEKRATFYEALELIATNLKLLSKEGLPEA